MSYLLNITACPPGETTATTLRFCAGSAGYKTGPAESPANTVWMPGVNVAFRFSRELFGGREGGASRIGAGEIELTNDDGHLDVYDSADWAFEGHEVEVLSGDQAAAYDDFSVVFRGVIESVEHTWKAMTLNIRDRQKDLDKALPIPKYAGTNSGATGVEGTEDDLKGKVKPFAAGYCHNVTPLLVNSSTLIYQVHFRACQAIPAVYSNGSALTATGTDYATPALLAAATIPSGSYSTCLAYGLFRINTSSGTTITCDVQGDNVGGYVTTTADVCRRILEIHGWTSADWNAASLTALNTANSAPVELYDVSGEKVRALLDKVCAGAWAWYCPDRQGVMQFGRVEAPTGTPVLTLEHWQVIDLERITDDLAGGPWSLVTMTCCPNWTTQEGDGVAASVDSDRVAWLAQESRSVTSSSDGEPDATILARRPLAEQVEFTSLFSVRSDAQAEVERRAAFRSTPRRAFRFTLSVEFAMPLDLGQVIAVSSERFGLSATLVRIIGMEDMPDGNTVEMTVHD